MRLIINEVAQIKAGVPTTEFFKRKKLHLKLEIKFSNLAIHFCCCTNILIFIYLLIYFEQKQLTDCWTWAGWGGGHQPAADGFPPRVSSPLCSPGPKPNKALSLEMGMRAFFALSR